MRGSTIAEVAAVTMIFIAMRAISVHVVLSGFALLTEVMKR